jgi:hypothetical protein
LTGKSKSHVNFIQNHFIEKSEIVRVSSASFYEKSGFLNFNQLLEKIIKIMNHDKVFWRKVDISFHSKQDIIKFGRLFWRKNSPFLKVFDKVDFFFSLKINENNFNRDFIHFDRKNKISCKFHSKPLYWKFADPPDPLGKFLWKKWFSSFQSTFINFPKKKG